MNYIASVGEKVLYTGNISYSIPEIIIVSIKRHLIANNWYVVRGVHRFYDENISELGYYRFWDVGYDLWAPCESFRPNAKIIRKYYKDKYNLK